MTILSRVFMLRDLRATGLKLGMVGLVVLGTGTMCEGFQISGMWPESTDS